MQNRKQLLISWLSIQFSAHSIELTPLLGDAGFRQYYRFSVSGVHYIAVDAPPQWSNNLAFVEVADSLAKQGVIVPSIIAKDLDQGLLCLSDFGDSLLFSALNSQNMVSYYQQLMTVILKITNVKSTPQWQLPMFNRTFIATELSIMPQWFLQRHLGLSLSSNEESQLNACFDILIDNALEQPQVTMHRDLQSRNIMLLANGQLGIIDFQDAVNGPVTYDIVSLLRDVNVMWPQGEVYLLLEQFRLLLIKHKVIEPVEQAQFERWFDLMGLQRHCKIAGIFARLLHRDNKPGYVKDIPRTLKYIIDIAHKYPELTFLANFTQQRLLPLMSKKVA